MQQRGPGPVGRSGELRTIGTLQEIDQVWRAAFEKRCQTILVETGFEYPADLDPQGDRLLPYTGQGAAALDDAVDEVIEKVLADGGEVFFYEPGALDLHQRIAAISCVT